MIRLGYGRVAQETNALSPLASTLDDFRRVHWLEGAELHAACRKGGTEAKGFMDDAELSGFLRAVEKHGEGKVEAVPLLSAWAIPSGPLAQGAFEDLKGKMEAQIERAGPLDGLFFSLHGAMRAQGVEEPEAALVEAAVAAAGGKPVAASYDLHGHLNRRKMQVIPWLQAYRTNPHRDHAETGFKAGSVLVRALLGRVRPTVAWRALPMVLGGGLNLDFLNPMRPLFAHMKKLEKDPRVLGVSLFCCHPWNDAADLGWAVHVVTDGDEAMAEQIAEDLAERAWAQRHHLPPEIPTASEVIREARGAWLARKLGTVTVCDASDVVGAGAPGASTGLLRAMLEEGKDLKILATIRDPALVAAAWDKPEGSPVAADLAGELAVSGALKKKAETPFGRTLVLDLGHLQLVVTESPPLAMKPAFYRDLGLEPLRADMVMVKSFFPFRLYFLAENRKTLYARTEGVTDLDAVRRLRFDGPVHPVDEVADWREGDRRRRLG